MLVQRSVLELESHRPDAARSAAERALALEQKLAEPGTLSNRVGLAHLALARALRAQGKLPEAQAGFAAALAQLEPSLGADHPETQEARRGAGVAVAGPAR